MKTDYMYLCLAISIITSKFYEKLTFKNSNLKINSVCIQNKSCKTFSTYKIMTNIT